MSSSTDTLASPVAPRPPGGEPVAAADGLAEMGERGRLQVADRVIEKIASYAAGEVDRATGSPRRILGMTLSSDPRAPRVSAVVDGEVATVDIDMSVAWPAPIREVTRQVRQHVVTRLHDLAGITRAQVDITVTSLAAEPSQERRVD